MQRLFTIIVFAIIAISSADGIEIHVSPDGNDAGRGSSCSPFATLSRAQCEVRRIRRERATERCEVLLGPGVYRMDRPLAFAPEDSGTPECPVIWKGGGRAILSGNRELRGWETDVDGTWFIDLGADWNMPVGGLTIRGECRPRARWPKKGLFSSKLENGTPAEPPYGSHYPVLRFKEGELNANWSGLRDAELVMFHYWTDSHLRISNVDEARHEATLRYPAKKSFLYDGRWFLENVREVMTEPGEWCYERGNVPRLRYRPRQGEDPETCVAEVPVLEELVSFKAHPDEDGRWVENIRFEGLVFSGSAAELPEGEVNDWQGSVEVGAAVECEGARNCAFCDCSFIRLGGYAVALRTGCRDDRFERCRFDDLGAGGIMANGGVRARKGTPWKNEEDITCGVTEHPYAKTTGISVRDCEIARYGRRFRSGVGVLVMNAANCRVESNEIHDGFYTGISVGWTWGYDPSVATGNMIASNHIHHIGQGVLSDMGAIYTLGVSPGTVIRGNVIHDVDAHTYGGWGIYCDQGSSGILIEGNTVYKTKFAPFDMHFGRDVMVRGNVFALGREDQLSRSKSESHVSLSFVGNVVYWTSGKLFSGRWDDSVPYLFYTGPTEDRGMCSRNETFIMDGNVYFNPNLSIEEVRFGTHNGTGVTLDEWRAEGKDVHSIYADPMFADPAHGDFSLLPGSPVRGLRKMFEK